MNINNKVKK